MDQLEKINLNNEEEIEEMSAKIKLKRLQTRLIIALLVGALSCLLILVVWSQHAEINRLKDELDDYKDMPSVVTPINPEISLDVINTEIKGIGELATVEYLYTNAATFTDSRQIKNWNIPFTEKSFIIRWDGVIKAGIDVTKISTKINRKDRIITVLLPEATILSHDPDKESVEILYENDSFFNHISVEDQAKFDASMEKEMEQRAIENGLLEQAQENAEQVLYNLLSGIPGIDGYSIEVISEET